jgi:diguanylate cyclase (GGDEF)-like protein
MNTYTPTAALYDLRNQRARILVVDDQPVNIRAIHQIFADDHDVFMATNGEQAIAFCQKTPPDMVLLDVMMPGMDGLEVCSRLKRHRETQSIPVIFVTSYQHSHDETACWEAGGVDFVNKPVNPTTLRNRVRAHLSLKFQSDMLRGMAFIDGLTNIANRRCFDDKLQAEWRRCSRSGSALGLLMIDVDFFKRYNDHYGHQAGDDCLRLVALVLKSNLKRPFDLAARYGGEEFACLLPETDLVGASVTAATLEDAVRKLQIEHVKSDIAQVVTISVGASACYPNRHDTSASLVQMADSQLYLAKQRGRGQICAESSTLSAG